MTQKTPTEDQAFAKTFLLLGNYRPALVIAEKLHAKGHRVIVGIEGCDRGAEFSRFVDEIWQHGAVSESPATFDDQLRVFLNTRPDIRYVIPIAEQFVRHFAEAQYDLPANVRLIMNAPNLVRFCLDKTALLDAARHCRVPIAEFETVANTKELNAACRRLGYPLVVRPMQSTQRLNDLKAITLQSASCLARYFDSWPAGHTELLLQTKALGRRHNIYFAATNGSLVRYLHARIERTDRLDGSGLAVDGITIPPGVALMDHTAALVKRLEYTGIGCAQFLVDDETGSITFLEINARFAGNHFVPEYCGLELTEFMLDLADGKDVKTTPIKCGKTGVRYGWLSGDLEGLKTAIRNREVGIVDACKWFAAACLGYARSEIDMMIVWRDPLPGFASLLKVVPGMARHINRKVRAQKPASDPEQFSKPIEQP